jgi:DNA-binding beta-propeller fold protein YncE
MGTRSRILAASFSAGLVAVVATASAAPGLRISLVRGPGQPTTGHAVTVIVRSAAHTKIKVWIAQASVSRSFRARPLSHGRYGASVVFPKAGRWTFGARAGGARVRLGSVSVRPRTVPLTFAWPTSVDVEADGSLLVAENGNQSSNGRVDRIDPATGKTVEIAEADQAYSVAHAPSGAVYLSAGKSLLRLDGAGQTTPVAHAAEDIGPIAVAANGDVYYATQTQVFKLAGGTGTPVQIVAGLSGPHGLAVLNDGGLLVSDTGHARVVRVDLGTGKVETWGDLVNPRGIAIAPDRNAYVVDASIHQVVRLRIDGLRLGAVKHVFYDPYAVAAAPDGSLYVVDTAAVGRLYRVLPDGKTTVVSRPGS